MKLLFLPRIVAAAFLFCSLLSAAQAASVYSNGHADIGLAFEDEELYLHYHFGYATLDGVIVPDAEYDPEDIYVEVSDANLGALPNATYAAMFGKPVGSQVWALPQSNTPGVPFLGFATEELDSAWTNLAFRLVGFDYEGSGVDPEFALWTTNFFGAPDPIMVTADGVNPVDDVLEINYGTHSHFNWGFTDPGLYELTIEAVGTYMGDSYTSTGTFSFLVGGYEPEVPGVPEPSSLALLGAGAFCALFVRRRRANQP